MKKHPDSLWRIGLVAFITALASGLGIRMSSMHTETKQGLNRNYAHSDSIKKEMSADLDSILTIVKTLKK